MDMPKELEERIGEIELVLKRYLPKEEGHQKTVLEAMNYSLLAGGKRLRPMLMRETYRLFSGESTIIEPFLAAIEMVHTYSLVHDDLPAMDNDEYRRGKKTTHIAYGEAMAILAGDALLNYAYETAAQAFCMAKDGETDRVIQAFSVFANKAGIYGMVGGQTADVESEGAPSISGEKLDFIYRKKTGALMESAMQVGAILAGASVKEQRLVEELAGEVGLAFQIQDDILDQTSTFEKLGKPIGSDAKNEKRTYVQLYGMEKAKEDVIRLFSDAMEKLASLPGDNPFLNELLRYIVHREK